MGRKDNSENKKNTLFASVLRNLMNDRKSTQEDLAKVTGKTRQTVSQYTNGISEPSYETLVKIADYYDVSIDYLLGRTGDPKRTPSAIDELSISSNAISMLLKSTPSQKEIINLFLSNNDFFTLCSQISDYLSLPDEDRPTAETLNIWTFVDQADTEKNLMAELIDKHPEYRGRVSITFGVDHAERIKERIVGYFSSILHSMQ